MLLPLVPHAVDAQLGQQTGAAAAGAHADSWELGDEDLF
jgi:hypothetical protein